MKTKRDNSSQQLYTKRNVAILFDIFEFLIKKKNTLSFIDDSDFFKKFEEYYNKTQKQHVEHRNTNEKFIAEHRNVNNEWIPRKKKLPIPKPIIAQKLKINDKLKKIIWNHLEYKILLRIGLTSNNKEKYKYILNS